MKRSELRTFEFAVEQRVGGVHCPATVMRSMEGKVIRRAKVAPCKGEEMEEERAQRTRSRWSDAKWGEQSTPTIGILDSRRPFLFADDELAALVADGEWVKKAHPAAASGLQLEREPNLQCARETATRVLRQHQMSSE